MSRTPKFEANEFSKRIGRRLRWLRQIQDLTLDEMEVRSKVTGKTIQRYERGGISIPLDAVEALAGALNVSPTRLCGPMADFAWLVQEQVAQIESPNVLISKDADVPKSA